MLYGFNYKPPLNAINYKPLPNLKSSLLIQLNTTNPNKKAVTVCYPGAMLNMMVQV